MWSPADKYALPSEDEIQRAKEAIELHELQLQEAINAQSVKSQIALRGKTELEVLRAWIAPIRKVPVEILTEIFILAGERDHSTAMHLAAVCRLWRDVVLAAPRAWTFIYLTRFRHQNNYPKYIQLLFERGNPALLHLTVPHGYRDDRQPYTAPPGIEHASNLIECLRMSIWDLQNLISRHMESAQFPKLQWLVLMKTNLTTLESSIFDQRRFPALQSLHLLGPCEETIREIPSAFAHLQHLTVVVDENHLWLKLIQNCAHTLKSLEIRGHRAPLKQMSPEPKVVLPLLQYLKLSHHSLSEKYRPHIKAVTPVLRSVHARGRHDCMQTVFEAENDKVTHLRLGDHFIPSKYPAVRILQVDYQTWCTSRQDIADYVAELGRTVSGCRFLETVEINRGKARRVFGLDSIMRTIGEKLREAGMTAALIWSKEWTINMPGYEQTPCGDHMPCYSSDPDPDSDSDSFPDPDSGPYSDFD